MRTKNLFRCLMAAGLAVISFSASAQYLTTSGTATVDESAAPNVTEYVTIGSKMPYKVTPSTPDAGLAPLLDPAVFRWAVAGASTPTPTKLDGNILTPAPAPDAASHKVENEVAVHWATLGNHTISVWEKSQTTAAAKALGLADGCEGNEENISVVVVDKPTADWTETDNTMGACSIGDVVIQADATGFDQFRFTYSYVYTTFAGVAAAPVTATTAALGSADFTPGGTETIDVFTLSTGTNYGKYEITMLAVTDRISRKSLSDYDGDPAADDDGYTDPFGLLGANDDQDPGVPTVDVLTIYNLPTPTTGKILKVTNDTW